MMVQLSLMAPAQEDVSEPRWFTADGCVVAHAEHTEVFVGGTPLCANNHETPT